MLNETQFPFLAEKGHIVSLVGGGGKTTLLHAMAAHCANKGWRVLASTTTHIQRPAEPLWAKNDEELMALWAAESYAVAGAPAPGNKLTQPPQLERWTEQADVAFLEADGAKRMPCKAPAAHEPVLLPQSDVVLDVAGLSAIGRPLQDVCFRLETACTLLGVSPETILTPELLAKLLASEKGGRKSVEARCFYVVLNQADTLERQAAGKQTQQLLKSQYGVEAVLTEFSKKERA